MAKRRRHRIEPCMLVEPLDGRQIDAAERRLVRAFRRCRLRCLGARRRRCLATLGRAVAIADGAREHRRTYQATPRRRAFNGEGGSSLGAWFGLRGHARLIGLLPSMLYG